MWFQDSSVGWLTVIVLFFEMVLVVFLMTPEYAANARRAEHQSAIALFGEEEAGAIRDSANRWFSAHLVDSGFINHVHAMLIPNAAKKQKAPGMSNFLPQVFEWVATRLEGIWASIYGVYHRLFLLGVLLIFCLGLIAACAIDALVQRKIRIIENGVPNAVFYHAAKKAAAVLLVSPLFIAFLPFQITTSFWYIIFFLIPCILWVTLTNVQEL